MCQIDIMVNAKKVEWDSQLHVLQLQLDKKKKEAGILKIEVGAKMQEVLQYFYLGYRACKSHAFTLAVFIGEFLL